MYQGLRNKVFRTLAPVRDPSAAKRPVAFVLTLTIVLSTIATMVLTVPERNPAWDKPLERLLTCLFLLFSLEFLLRVWIAPLADPTRPLRAIRRYLWSFLGALDLLVPFIYWLSRFFPMPDWAPMLVTLFSMFKFARLVPGLAVFTTVFKNEGRSLLSGLLLLIVLLVVTSGIMFILENPAQPEIFRSVPRTLWWGIVTIASVGYGDMTPATPIGRLVAGILMLLGIAVFAVPAGILATGFAKELRKRDFMVTWQTVAKMPLFSGLDASRIASIARLLTSDIIPPDTVIVRKGDQAEAMFFILQGEVEVQVSPNPVRLRGGQYFGEIALLKDTERTATVISTTEVHLLVLDVSDFRRLMKEHPEIKAAIANVADARIARGKDA